MAITKYLQKCDYSIGGLQPYIYLIHKNTLTVRIKAKGVEVFFKEVPKNGAETEIYKIYGASCVYNQEETYHNKYRFNSTLELTINEQYKEPFLYGLRTLRTNQYYIIVEDKKGTQYLINPELYTNLNYEYNFFDGGDTQNSCIISWNNLSNYPLLIMDEKIDNNFVLLFEECPYNIGSIEWLRICHKGELSTKDDGVKITDMYFSNIDLLHTIDFLKETFTYNETYDGNMFRTTLSFSIPLSDNQFNWHYNLLEFEKNRYTAFFKTTNHNYFVSGVEKGLRPKYNITTSEDDETPNMINITFEQTSQYPMIWTDSVVQYQWREDEQMCIGYDKYQMLAQQYSLDWGRTWVDTNPIVKKKGDIIESDSEECEKYQWVENGEVCVVDSNEIVKWKETDGYICQDCGKYRKLQKMVSTDSGKTFKDTDEYYIGAPMLDEEGDCQFVMARWVDAENQYLCFPVDETKTKWEVYGTLCENYAKYNKITELVTNNGNIYYKSGINKKGELIEYNSCDCEWNELNEYKIGEVCYNDKSIENNEYEVIAYRKHQYWLNEATEPKYRFNVKGYGKYFVSLIVNDITSSSLTTVKFSKIDTSGTTNSGHTSLNVYNKTFHIDLENPYYIDDDKEHFIDYIIPKTDGTGKPYKVTFYVLLLREKQDYTLYDVLKVNKECKDNIIEESVETLLVPKENNSYSCGYEKYEWEYTNEIECVNVNNAERNILSFKYDIENYSGWTITFGKKTYNVSDFDDDMDGYVNVDLNDYGYDGKSVINVFDGCCGKSPNNIIDLYSAPHNFNFARLYHSVKNITIKDLRIKTYQGQFVFGDMGAGGDLNTSKYSITDCKIEPYEYNLKEQCDFFRIVSADTIDLSRCDVSECTNINIFPAYTSNCVRTIILDGWDLSHIYDNETYSFEMGYFRWGFPYDEVQTISLKGCNEKTIDVVKRSLYRNNIQFYLDKIKIITQ